jgi:hypothetical protein
MRGRQTTEPKYRIKIEFPDGSVHEQGNVYKLETDFGIDGRENIVTYDDVQPTHYLLESGTKITITKWDLEEWLRDYPEQKKNE